MWDTLSNTALSQVPDTNLKQNMKEFTIGFAFNVFTCCFHNMLFSVSLQTSVYLSENLKQRELLKRSEKLDEVLKYRKYFEFIELPFLYLGVVIMLPKAAYCIL